MAMREERAEGRGREGRMGIWRENPLELVIRLALLFHFWWGRSSFFEHMHAKRQGHRSRRGESQSKTLALRGTCKCPETGFRIYSAVTGQSGCVTGSSSSDTARPQKLEAALRTSKALKCRTEVMRTSPDTSGRGLNYAAAHEAWV